MYGFSIQSTGDFMIKNRQFPALRDSEAERRRSDHARQPPLLREGGRRRVERIRQRHLQLFRRRERQRLPRCHPQAQQRLRYRPLQSSSLLPHWAMPSFIFSFLYLLFLFFARKAEPEVVVAEVRSTEETVRHTTVPRIAIAAATTVHTAGTQRRSLWVAL